MYSNFESYFPKIAKKETRFLTFLESNMYGIPEGQYALLDYYCIDKNCDCRTVYIKILDFKGGEPLATISYGWEPLQFYLDWMKGVEDDEDDILENLKGPALVQLLPQSQHADKWLTIFKEIINSDKDYVNRIIRHYNLVKSAIGKT